MAEWLPRLVDCEDQSSRSVLSKKMGDGDQTVDKRVVFFRPDVVSLGKTIHTNYPVIKLPSDVSEL